MTDLELAEAARPLLDALYASELEAAQKLFETRKQQGRTTTDIAQAARVATFGAVDTLLVDIDAVVPGWIDEDTGAVRFADAEGAASYGVVDAIAARALASGARVLAVRKGDLPGSEPLAAVLRYAI